MSFARRVRRGASSLRSPDKSGLLRRSRLPRWGRDEAGPRALLAPSASEGCRFPFYKPPAPRGDAFHVNNAGCQNVLTTPEFVGYTSTRPNWRRRVHVRRWTPLGEALPLRQAKDTPTRGDVGRPEPTNESRGLIS